MLFVSCTLGAEFSGKIYQHLIRLPSQFLINVNLGKIIARIQELAHIRQFITGSALMMVLDFYFYYRISFSNVCLFRIINLDNHSSISRLLFIFG